MDYNFTAKVELEFDDIADGKVQWQDMLESFYRPFHKTVETTEEKSERASGERLLGLILNPEKIFTLVLDDLVLLFKLEKRMKWKKFASLKKSTS